MWDPQVEERARALARTCRRLGLRRLRAAGEGWEIEVRLRPEHAAAVSSPPEPIVGTRAATEPGRYDVLTSEIVGRVRLGRPPITVGMVLDADREVASIEALGIRNPVRSRGGGRVAVVYVEEGQAVDYGAPLLAIDRTSCV